MHFFGGVGNGLAVANFWERLQARRIFGARRGTFWAVLDIFLGLYLGVLGVRVRETARYNTFLRKNTIPPLTSGEKLWYNMRRQPAEGWRG